MKRAGTLLMYVFMMLHLLACAQTKNLIKKTYATYSVHIPGNIPVDQNGNEIPVRDTVFTVYVESTSADVNWSSAWFDGKSYTVIANLIDTSQVDAGTLMSNNQKLVIKKTLGSNTLWHIQLLLAQKILPSPVTPVHGQIIIVGKYHGKKILKKITSMMEIEGIPTP